MTLGVMDGDPIIPSFLVTLAALVLLMLVTFSAPFIPSLYFLRATVPGGTVRFGLWGYCYQGSGVCTPKALGYHWEPQIVFGLTEALVLLPIATGFTLLLTIAILPSVLLHFRRDTIFPPPLYSLLAIPAGLVSLLAFVLMITLFSVAKSRFLKDGMDAAFGPLPWMTLAATVLLIGLMLYTGCGSTWRGCLGQMSPHIRSRSNAIYTY